MKYLQKQILSRIENFWGYGNLESQVWFVGMEEGLEAEATLTHLAERFRVADGQSSVDMRGEMNNVYGHMRWFRPGAPIQQTWKYPIALYLYLKNGCAPTKEEIRTYQVLRLGDYQSRETVTIELMPLPSNKANESAWLYGDLGISHLSNRAEYLATYKPKRVRKLQGLLQRYHPQLVIFSSLMYLPDWKKIIGKEPKEMTRGMYFAQSNITTYCIIPQGVSFGMSYKRLYGFAEKIRTNIQLV